MKNLRKSLMKMNLPSSHGRFARCGKIKANPDGRTPKK